MTKTCGPTRCCLCDGDRSHGDLEDLIFVPFTFYMFTHAWSQLESSLLERTFYNIEIWVKKDILVMKELAKSDSEGRIL